jgi:hypothetical protein
MASLRTEAKKFTGAVADSVTETKPLFVDRASPTTDQPLVSDRLVLSP